MTQAPWFRELLAGGKGPDWLFNATFTLDSAGALAAALRDHAPAGFSLYRATQRPCPIHGGLCDYALYVDTPHYQACVEQLEDRSADNMYIYHTIQLCRHDYQIVRGYGGYPGQYGDAETRSIRGLAQAPGIVMAKWSIVYGGMTYPYETLTSDTTSAALLEYLEAKA